MTVAKLENTLDLSSKTVTLPNNSITSSMLQPGAAVPSGAVFYFAANSAPSGYLEANGAAISRTTYAALFAVVGTTFGTGDGSSTFNLPDLRGEFLRGWDNGKGTDSGRTFGSSQTDSTALPNSAFGTSNPGDHTHGYSDEKNGNGGGQGGGGANTGTVSSNKTTSGGGGHTHTITGGDSETRPRNIALLPCIKT